MKKLLTAALVLAAFVSTSFAVNYDGILNFVTLAETQKQIAFDALAKDMGAILGGGMHHQAKTLGVLGFDIGVRTPMQTVNKDDKLLTDQNLSQLGLAFVQLEKGLPGKIDLLARGFSGEGLTATGFGARYSLVSLVVVNVSLVANYNTMTHDYLKGTTTGVGVTASLNIPVIQPYIGITSESTSVTPGAKAAILEGSSGKSSGLRLEGGINFSPFPLLYIYGGYTMVADGTGYSAALGLKF
ncbi:MAG: hypothetical protein KKH91_01665 [Elusimicrobia bacterium]|nr:hypothetical protein [Elusimicrobiota bacterium]MBU2615460.1 hypothetical protein [Elusimicrobiota bacterium]